jgi:hypothetical protein
MRVSAAVSQFHFFDVALPLSFPRLKERRHPSLPNLHHDTYLRPWSRPKEEKNANVKTRLNITWSENSVSRLPFFFFFLF